MAFNVQNDLGTVSDANAYITVAEYRAYWADRNIDTTSQIDATVQGLIVDATQYIGQRFEYCGQPLEGRDQTTSFPRSYLYDSFCNLVTGVPREVKNACAEYARLSTTTPLSIVVSASDKSIKKESDKVDVLESSKEYAGTKASAGTWGVYQIADNILTSSGFVHLSTGFGRA